MKLGFGASGPWGSSWFNEKKASALIEQALTLGIHHFDTAGFYSGGLAEERLGRVLMSACNGLGVDRNSIIISTKIGKRIGDDNRTVRDFSRQSVQHALNLSRRRLGTDTLDIVYMHGPDEHEQASILPFLLEQKDQGVVKAIGICSDGPALKHAAAQEGVDSIMGRYNITHTEHVNAFRIAKQSHKTVAGIAPLAQGLWRKSMAMPRTLSDVWYLARAVRRSRNEFRTLQQADWLRQVDGWTPVELSLAFVRLNPDIDISFTTTTRRQHLVQTCEASRREIPKDIADLLRNNPITD